MKIVIKKDIKENGSIIGAVTTGALLWKKGNDINYIATDFPEVVEKITEKEYSFLLFLHGAGNRGDDNEKQVIQNTGLLNRIITGETVT